MVSLFVSLFVLVVFTGCLGNDEVEEDGNGAAFTEDTGSLSGTVFDENLNPLNGALVTLVQLQVEEAEAHIMDKTADQAGKYAINQIPPGSYRAQVSSACCHEAVENLDIVAGEPTTKDFMLNLRTQEERRDPWVDGAHEWNGNFECVAGTVNVCQNNERRQGQVVEPGARTVTVGLDWEPNALLGAQELRLRVLNGGNDEVIMEETGGPGFQIVLDQAMLAEEKVDDDTWTVVFDVQAAGTDVLYGQRFTIWWTLHYWDPAPDGYSTIPDQ